MPKTKYKYNTKSLSYEEVEINFKHRILKVLSYLGTSALIAIVFIFVFFNYFNSPKEIILKRELDQLTFQYDMLDHRMNQITDVLADLEDRDNNIYRTIFEADPIPDNIRKAGFGGVDKYKNLQGFSNSDLMVRTSKKLDQLAKQLYIQSKSFDDVGKLAKNKAQMLASIPAIQPLANTDLKRMASGFGYRTHPIYKTRLLHTGMDFTASVGTEIYATGDGKVVEVKKESRGYGYHIVIDHGYGYKTLYAHMSKFAVKSGQKIKRGDVIGYVGNTGTSTAPHLHYEVLKNGAKINPVNFFYNDLSPEEYAQMIELSSTINQSFD